MSRSSDLRGTGPHSRALDTVADIFSDYARRSDDLDSNTSGRYQHPAEDDSELLAHDLAGRGSNPYGTTAGSTAAHGRVSGTGTTASSSYSHLASSSSARQHLSPAGMSPPPPGSSGASATGRRLSLSGSGGSSSASATPGAYLGITGADDLGYTATSYALGGSGGGGGGGGGGGLESSGSSPAGSSAAGGSTSTVLAASALQRLSGELDGVRRAWREEGTGLRARLLDMHRQRVQLEQKLAEAEARLARLQSEAKEKEASLSAQLHKERSTLAEERSSARDKASEWQAELRRFAAQLDELRGKYTEELKRRREAESAENAARTALAARTEEAAAQATALAALQERLEATRTELAEERARFEREVRTLSGALQDERDAMTSKADDANKREMVANERARAAEARAAQLSTELDADRSRFREEQGSLRARLAEVEEDRRRAIAEGHRLRDLLRTAESEFQAVASAVDAISSGRRPPTSPTSSPSFSGSGTGGGSGSSGHHHHHHYSASSSSSAGHY